MAKQRPLRKDALAKVIQVEKPELPKEHEAEKPQAKIGNATLISQPALYIVGIIHNGQRIADPIIGFIVAASAKDHTVPVINAISTAEAATRKFNNVQYDITTNTVKMTDIALQQMVHLNQTYNNICEKKTVYAVSRNVVAMPGNRQTTTYTLYLEGTTLKTVSEQQLKNFIRQGGVVSNFKFDGDTLSSKNANTVIEYSQSIVRPKPAKTPIDRTKEKLANHAKFVDAFVNNLMHETLAVTTADQQISTIDQSGHIVGRAISMCIPQPARRAMKTMTVKKFAAILIQEILPLYYSRMKDVFRAYSCNELVDTVRDIKASTAEEYWKIAVTRLADSLFVPYITEQDLVKVLSARYSYYKGKDIYYASDARYIFCKIDSTLDRISGLSYKLTEKHMPNTTYSLTLKDFKYLLTDIYHTVKKNNVGVKLRLEDTIGAGLSVLNFNNNLMLVGWPHLNKRFAGKAIDIAEMYGDASIIGFINHIFSEYVMYQSILRKDDAEFFNTDNSTDTQEPSYSAKFYLRRVLLMIDALYEYAYRVTKSEEQSKRLIVHLLNVIDDRSIDISTLIDAVTYSAVNHLHTNEEANYSVPILKLFIRSGGLMFPFGTRRWEQNPETSDIITPFVRVNALARKDAQHNRTHTNYLFSSLYSLQFKDYPEDMNALTNDLCTNEVKYTWIERDIRNLYFHIDFTSDDDAAIKYKHDFTNCFATHLFYFLDYYARMSGMSYIAVNKRITMRRALKDILLTLCIPYERRFRCAPDVRFKTVENVTLKLSETAMRLW